MNDNQRKVIIGGLLHDIGKVLYRSDDGRNHSQSGYDFLKNDVDIKRSEEHTSELQSLRSDKISSQPKYQTGRSE